MNRFIFIFIFCILAARAEAQSHTTNDTSVVVPGCWTFDISPDFSVPVQNWNPAYNFGIGSALGLDCGLDTHWKAGLSLDYFYFSGTNFAGSVSDNDLRILPRAAYYFSGGETRFYGLMEAGVAFQFAAAKVGAATNINFDGALGMGVERELGPKDTAFMEIKYNVIVASNVPGQDLCLGVGYRTSL